MSQSKVSGEALLLRLRQGKTLSLWQQIGLTFRLSIPAMLAQITSIIMQYIDASMVGQLGANDSGAIGLVSTSTWLFGGICVALTTGFTVQVAQQIGAEELRTARNTMKQGLVLSVGFSLLITLLAVVIHDDLPIWLGGNAQLCDKAAQYFLVYMLAIPAFQINSLAGGMLQSSGNMRIPSILSVLTCCLDVVFNALLIFPQRQVLLFGTSFLLPGANLGVVGAALGTALAEVVCSALMLLFLLFRSPVMRLRKGEPLVFSGAAIKRALRIALPVGFEQIVMCGAQVAATRIVSPLGTIALAANSFAVTAESLCYMPGYGIEIAATTLVGQSMGAGRRDMARRLGWIATGLGMMVMGSAAVLMYWFAPTMIGILSPDPAIRTLGTVVLRVEAFAEPLYAASIVASGVFRGAGDTLVPSCMSFLSMWFVRLPLAAWLAPQIGLRGVWIAMCIELCVRGILFLFRLKGEQWMRVTPCSASEENTNF